VVRYGGDEFLIILADPSAPRKSWKDQAYLREWNHARYLEDFEPSLSIGVSEWSDGKTLEEMLDVTHNDIFRVPSPPLAWAIGHERIRGSV
jgi:hypothetical protein